jgi:hypothetical protein
MAISAAEARRLFGKLATQLRERGAGTLVEQVIDEIAQGKQIVYKTVSPRAATRQLQRPEADEILLERGRRREYAETLEYSPHERLDLLLQGIERAILDAASIDTELVKHYGKVRFVPEQEEENARSFDLGSLMAQNGEIERLRLLIAELRASVEG